MYIHNFSPIRDISCREAGNIGKLLTKGLLLSSLLRQVTVTPHPDGLDAIYGRACNITYNITQVGEEEC